jgi:predicted amidohydrolase
MRVALGQIPVSSSPSVNLERVREALACAAEQGADLAVFPEATQVRFGSDLRAAAEPLDGPFGSGLAVAAKETGVALVAGVFEPAPDGRVYNTAVAFDGHGELVAAYRKLHLFDAFGHRESEVVAPGSAPVLCALAGVRTGLEICYDVRFGELSRALAVAGADLLVLPAAWAAGPLKEEHWVTLVRARAIENTVWVAAVGQVPDPSEPATRAATGVGRSMLVDPLGVVRLDLGPSAGVALGSVDVGLVQTVRAAVPSLANRREDVFGPPVLLALSGQRTGDCQKTGCSPAGVAVKPTPVSVRSETSRPVMAWMPVPVRPCPVGVTACQAEPLAEVHTTTS